MKHRIVKGISKKVLLPPSKLYYQGNFKKGFFAPPNYPASKEGHFRLDTKKQVVLMTKNYAESTI
jgi:hypothetical protein